MLFFSIFLWLLRTFKYWQRFDLATAQPRLVCCFTTKLILVRVLACSVMLVMPCKHPLYRIQKRIIAVSFASFVAVRGCAVGAQTKIPTDQVARDLAFYPQFRLNQTTLLSTPLLTNLLVPNLLLTNLLLPNLELTNFMLTNLLLTNFKLTDLVHATVESEMSQKKIRDSPD